MDKGTVRTKICVKCAKELPLSEYEIKYSYSGKACYNCQKLKTNENNRLIREKIKKASGDCWWVEQWCYASLHYYGTGKKR